MRRISDRKRPDSLARGARPRAAAERRGQLLDEPPDVDAGVHQSVTCPEADEREGDGGEEVGRAVGLEQGLGLVGPGEGGGRRGGRRGGGGGRGRGGRRGTVAAVLRRSSCQDLPQARLEAVLLRGEFGLRLLVAAVVAAGRDAGEGPEAEASSSTAAAAAA